MSGSDAVCNCVRSTDPLSPKDLSINSIALYAFSRTKKGIRIARNHQKKYQHKIIVRKHSNT